MIKSLPEIVCLILVAQISACSEIGDISEPTHEELAMKFFEEDLGSQRMFAPKPGESEVPQHVLLASMLGRCDSNECLVGDVVESKEHVKELSELCARKKFLKSEYKGTVVVFSRDTELLFEAQSVLERCGISSQLRKL